MLYSVGKDSSVMLHLALKAFYPSRPPFPLLHVDTTWKFQAMYAFRDRLVAEKHLDLLVHRNPDGVQRGINPFDHGSAMHTDIWKTEGLKQALDKYGFDLAFGGARRDEEKSRAKERVFSIRSAQHRWDPKQQRPELWRLYNTRKAPGQSIRVFPLSNWTELDIWLYIHRENIPIVPLYFAAPRPVVERDGVLIMVDDERMPLNPGEVPEQRSVPFRTLGCYPLTGAVESSASTLTEIIQEMLLTTSSERQGRVIEKPAVVWFTGLSGAGKSTIANLVEKRLHDQGFHTYLLDGDNIRHGLNKDLGFTEADRVENIRRIAEVARLMVDAGLIVLTSFISPFRAERQLARDLLDPGEFIEVHVDTPLEVAESRDRKGLYAKARAGELTNFTGIDSPYEPPSHPDIHLDASGTISPETNANQVVEYLREVGILTLAGDL